MLSTGGTLLDGYVIFVGVAMPIVIAEFHIQSDVVGLIGASLVFGAVIGAGLGGPMADHLGRKNLMLADMMIIGVGAFISALADGPASLFIGQLLVGIGVNIDFPVSSSYVSEVLPKRGRIRMQGVGFAGMAVGMLLLLAAVGLTNSTLQIPLVFTGFNLFNLLMNAGPNSTTFTLAPIFFPTQLRGTAAGFAAGVAKLGATLGVFLLPIAKETFGVAPVLGFVSAVSVLGLVITVILGHEDTE